MASSALQIALVHLMFNVFAVVVIGGLGSVSGALVGALIVLHADLLGRVAFLPKDLPAGIFVSGVGAPFFVYLLYRHRDHSR